MKIVKNIKNLKDLGSDADTLIAEGGIGIVMGNFDGLHLGHQHFLREIIKDTKVAKDTMRYSLPFADPIDLAVLTFFPHPVQVVGGLGYNSLSNVDNLRNYLITRNVEIYSHTLTKNVRQKIKLKLKGRSGSHC
ncbi:MAG: hypothetical protein HQK53_19600 [Oligoflexia bacterium]|nr:hypothetical protein [Oligoflexia bacterium]